MAKGQGILNWIYKKFSEDAPGMVITTSVIGWLASMVAQTTAIIMNPKIKEEQKVFLIPQEFNDALLNIGTFLLVTLLTKKTVSKMFSTGKLLPKTVKEYISKHPKLYEGKIGKVEYDIGKDLKAIADKNIYNSYKTCKNFGTTVATLGAGILATNIITPIARNQLASKVQKTYINEYIEPATVTTAPQKPQQDVLNNKSTEDKATVPAPQISSLIPKGTMRI